MNFDFLIVFLLGLGAGLLIITKAHTVAAFRRGFKHGYNQGCMHAKMVVNLFDNNEGNPSATFYKGAAEITTMANYPPEGRDAR